MNLVIKGFIQTSLLDWDGKIVSTLYTPHCNFRCPYCQNAGLIITPQKLETISFRVIKEYLLKNNRWIDGICLTGGEPCMYKDLPKFIQKIRELDVMVKLDTNGGFPDMLAEVIKRKLVNYIAMDIKAALDFTSYSKSTGIKNPLILEKVKDSIRLIMESDIDYEFRTTVVPTLHKEGDILRIAEFIKGAKKYAMQNFSVQGEILDPKFKKVKPYPIEKLNKIQKLVSPYVEECVVRGS
ncbi:anaerobic ribonucleoside-triphosphate reductase activating protein [bacterium]|nr:anaerobic ribonucleoside-triphosphate reductase activating protein [bacterium]